MNARAVELTGRVRAALGPELLHPRYRSDPRAHCYVASEALYHALGGREAGWVPACAPYRGGTHWWLENRRTDEILDATAEQLENAVAVYRSGVRKGFLTRGPSRRAAEVLRRIGEL